MLTKEQQNEFKAAYPKRSGDQGWVDAWKQIARRIAEGHELETIMQGVRNYQSHCVTAGIIGTTFVKQAATFVGPGCWFDEWASMDVRTPAQIAADAKLATLQARADALGVQVAGMDSRAAEEAIVQAERAALNRKWEQQGMNQPKVWAVK